MPTSQLTTDERYQITHLHMNGHTPAQIARQLGRHRATIGRELRRNLNAMGGYHYASAQPRAETRRSAASQRYKLDTPAPGSGLTPTGRYVRDKLKQRWSPEQIAGRLKIDYPDDSAAWISHETGRGKGISTLLLAFSALFSVLLPLFLASTRNSTRGA